MSRVWVLNLDAELEMEAGVGYEPRQSVRASVLRFARDFAKNLDSEDRVLDPPIDDRPVDRASIPCAWCPTPRAIAAFGRAQLAPPDAPSFDVLRRVNERGFAHAIAHEEIDAKRATEIETVEAIVSTRGPTGRWLLKRGFGVAGRGQRPIDQGELSEADRRWIASTVRRGAIYIEPRVDITRELSVHGWIRAAQLDIRSIREQQVDSQRAFTRSSTARDLAPGIERALIDRATEVGQRLIEAAYFGPFGIDAFEWRTPSGVIALRSLSEINARYCMGWDAQDLWSGTGTTLATR